MKDEKRIVRSYEFEVRAGHDDERGDQITGRAIVFNAQRTLRAFSRRSSLRRPYRRRISGTSGSW